MDIGLNGTMYRFEEREITATVQADSGTYALFAADKKTCVLIGESDRLPAKLLQLLQQPTPCLKKYQPKYFQYEVVIPSQRVKRRDELAIQLPPLCGKEGSS
jgi:hypothetical protein